jgi:hypothetical protein
VDAPSDCSAQLIFRSATVTTGEQIAQRDRDGTGGLDLAVGLAA